MKPQRRTWLVAFLVWQALALTARADYTITLSGVAMYCDACIKNIQIAVGQVDGVTATCNPSGSTVSLNGKDKRMIQQAVDAIVAAGFFGQSSVSNIKVNAPTGAPDYKLQRMDIAGAALCCSKCADAIEAGLAGVKGVKSSNPVAGAKSFTVTGDFKPVDVFTAVHNAGFSGHVATPNNGGMGGP